MTTPTDPRLLRELIREASQDETPELPWDRIEARLFAEIDGEVVPSGKVLSEDRPSVESAQIWRGDAVEAFELDDSPHRPSHLPGAVAEAMRTDTASAARVSGSTQTAASKPALRSRVARWVGVLAAAAAVAFVWTSHDRLAGPTNPSVAVKEPIDPSTIPLAAGLDGARDLAALREGDLVEAAVGPLAFGQAGSMQWTLSAGSRLVVRSTLESGAHAVELESGSMRGLVAPGSSMPLVVSAGETEVVSFGAGAIFSVTRSSRKLVLHLEEGAAKVGHRSMPEAGKVFVAPLVAAFSLDGGESYELLPSEVTSLDPRTAPDEVRASNPSGVESPEEQPIAVRREDVSQDRPIAQRDPARVAVTEPPKVDPVAPPSTSVAPAPAATTEPGVVDPTKDVRLSDSAVSSTLVSCIGRVRNERQAKAAEGVTVLINSTLRVQVNDDGSVKSAAFNPPLERELQGCAVFVLRSKLQPGARVLSIPISLP